jgi:hypothetical protein
MQQSKSNSLVKTNLIWLIKLLLVPLLKLLVMIYTEEDYNNAVKRRQEISDELIALDICILSYENEFKRPIFIKLDEIKYFIQYDSVEGSLFTYEGKTYEVGDYEEFKDDYGWENALESMSSATMEDLVDGSVSILTLVG